MAKLITNRITTLIDSKNLQSIVSAVTTAQTAVLFDNDCAMTVQSKAVAFAVVAKVAVAGHLTRSTLWLNGEQCERK
jgi:hypothetical protein